VPPSEPLVHLRALSHRHPLLGLFRRYSWWQFVRRIWSCLHRSCIRRQLCARHCCLLVVERLQHVNSVTTLSLPYLLLVLSGYIFSVFPSRPHLLALLELSIEDVILRLGLLELALLIDQSPFTSSKLILACFQRVFTALKRCPRFRLSHRLPGQLFHPFNARACVC
jgi:hypothetical protein